MRLDLNDPRQYCEFHARKLSAESGNQYAIFRALCNAWISEGQRKIRFKDLPANVQDHIYARLAD